MQDVELRQIADLVRAAAYDAHAYLRSGHREKVYENALANRLRKAGLEVWQQKRMAVLDQDGACVGEFTVDLLVDGRLIVEVKACRALSDDHGDQLLGYLRASRIAEGLLVNFGGARLDIMKYVVGDWRNGEESEGLKQE